MSTENSNKENIKNNLEMQQIENGHAVETDKRPKSPAFFGVRHGQILLSFLLAFIAYGVRVNLSVGIVAMTDPRASPNPDVPTFPDWHDKSIVLSSFFWGYVPPQAFAGQLAKKYGSKWFLVTTMALCGVFSLLIPTMAITYGSKGVMACRAIQGVGQGFIFPMLHDIISKWVPACERSRLGTFVHAGGPFGTVVSMVVTGLISASWVGWPIVFYLYGGLALLWVVAMAIFGCNSPHEHKTITQEEKDYITYDLHQSGNYPTPWKKIFSSMPVWAILVSHCGQNWGFWTLMTEIPTYMEHVMHFSIKSNSYLSALPYLTLWVLSFVFSELADMFINKKIASVATTRKIFNSIGLFIPAVALICLGFMNAEHQNIAVALLVLAVGMNGAIYCGYNVNHIDLSPNHSGVLMGLTNGTSNVFALLAPLFVQVIVTDETDSTQWRTVFFLTSTIYAASNTIFIIYGSGKLQPWNTYEKPIKNNPATIKK